MAALAEIAALGDAMCVALSNIIATPATRHFGPFAFNRWRLLAALAILAVVATLRSGFTDALAGKTAVLGLSAVVGIVIGDTAVYAAMARIGLSSMPHTLQSRLCLRPLYWESGSTG